MFSDFQVAQIDRQPDGRKERHRLREKSHDLAASPDQRNVESEQHQDERRPTRRLAGLLASGLKPLAAGGKKVSISS